MDTNLPAIQTAILALTQLSASERDRSLRIAKHLPTDAKRDEFLQGLILINARLEEAAQSATLALGVAKAFVEEGERMEKKLKRRKREKNTQTAEHRKREKLLLQIKNA